MKKERTTDLIEREQAMKKQTAILILAFLLVFACAFDVIYTPEEYYDGSFEVPAEQNEPTDFPAQEMTEEEQLQPIIDYSGPEEIYEPEPTEPVMTEPEPFEPEPQAPAWEDIDEDQVGILSSVYESMTGTGKNYSGWFAEGNHAPCTWQGISCENGRVTGLSFSSAGYFKTFPEAVLLLRDLKELHMVDTLIRGPLPETLFEDLQKLEVLELSGNFLTGEIPDLPDAFAVYPMLSEISISDNLADDFEKMQLLYRPEYSDIAFYQPESWEYPEIDLDPGLDGDLSEDWARLPLLEKIDLSGNQLSGKIPDSYAQLPLTELNLSSNSEPFLISKELYDFWTAKDGLYITADGFQIEGGMEEPAGEPTPEPVFELPTEEPTPEPVFEIPTEEPTPEPVFGFPTEEPTPEPVFEIPTEEPMPGPVFEFPTEEPTPEPVFVFPTEEPTPEPVIVIPVTEPTPMEGFDFPPERPGGPDNPPERPDGKDKPKPRPTKAPTQVPPTPIIIVVTATPVPQWYTATPQGYYRPQNPPVYPYNPPPRPYDPQPYQPYQPYQGNPQPYSYPTATPYTYTYTNPTWNYPTATSYPQYYQQYPTATAVPAQDPASLLGFTYKMAEMTGSKVPMTWRYTGMQDYSITYLDASGDLYPYYAMAWTSAADLCNASVCNADVENIPDELLRGGTFSLQLRARDASGNTYISDPVMMQVSLPEPTPVPTPEPQRSFLGGFFHWLFGPLIRLFGGK